MNQQQLAGDWNQLKGAIKQRWAQLTDQDFMGFEGDTDQLVGLIQRKTGEAREKIEEFLKESSSEASSVTQQVADKAKEMGAAVQERAGEAYDEVAERAQQGYEAVEEYVQEKPLSALGLAFGIGVLTGLYAASLLRSR